MSFPDDDIHRERATKQRDSWKQNVFYKKLWEEHQKNEYLSVNKYKEAICYGCFKRDIATATLVDICSDCEAKRGKEALLARVCPKFNGMCFFCGEYKWDIWQINCRLCLNRCNYKVRQILKNYNMKGGNTGVNPFWQHIRKKMGKDAPILFGGVKTKN